MLNGMTSSSIVDIRKKIALMPNRIHAASRVLGHTLEMRRATDLRHIRLAFVFLLGLGLAQPTGAQENAQPSIQSLFDSGESHLKEGRDQEAARDYYAALEALRAKGKAGTFDAGLVMFRLATALEKLNHEQTGEAYSNAVLALGLGENITLMLDAVEAHLAFLRKTKKEAEGKGSLLTLAARLDRGLKNDTVRLRAMEIGTAFSSRHGLEDLAMRFFLFSLGFESNEPRFANFRGLAHLKRNDSLSTAGDRLRASAELDLAISDLRLAGPEGQRSLRKALMGRGRAAMEDGEYQIALPVFEEAQKLFEQTGDEPTLWFETAVHHARMLERMERKEEALRVNAQAIFYAEKKTLQNEAALLALRMERVEYLILTGQKADAIALFNTEKDRIGTKAQPIIAALLSEKTASAQLALENFDEARTAAEHALALYREHFPQARKLQIIPLRTLAAASDGAKDASLSERAHRELIELSQELLPPNHPELARDLNDFANFLSASGRKTEAIAIERRVVDMLRSAYGPQGSKYAYALANLAGMYLQTGEEREGVPLLVEAIKIAEDKPELRGFQVHAMFNLASLLVEAGEARQGLDIAFKANNLQKQLPQPDERIAAGIGMVIVGALANLDDFEEAWNIGTQLLNRSHPLQTQEDLSNARGMRSIMAYVAERLGKYDDALKFAREASDVGLQKTIGETRGRMTRDLAVITARAAWAQAKLKK